LPKITTIYASTSLREIQGLEACVHLGSRDENLGGRDGILGARGQKFTSVTPRPELFAGKKNAKGCGTRKFNL
jgi:hypothetical protein